MDDEILALKNMADFAYFVPWDNAFDNRTG